MHYARYAAVTLVSLSALVGQPLPAAAAASLTLFVLPTSISFVDTDPDAMPLVPSTPSAVLVLLRVRGNGNNDWTLSLAANGPLTAGLSTIPASSITWTAAPASAPWAQGGTLALAPGQIVAAGRGNQRLTIGTLRFLFASSWNYAPGDYTTTATLTLSAP